MSIDDIAAEQARQLGPELLRLIADAGRATEVFGDDELEHFADEHRIDMAYNALLASIRRALDTANALEPDIAPGDAELLSVVIIKLDAATTAAEALTQPDTP